MRFEKYRGVKTGKHFLTYKCNKYPVKNTTSPHPQTLQECVYLTGRFTKGTDIMTSDITPNNGYISIVR